MDVDIMPGGKKGSMEGSSPSKHIHKVILSPKEYENLLVATAKSVFNNMR